MRRTLQSSFRTIVFLIFPEYHRQRKRTGSFLQAINKLYFGDIDGLLADVLEITIMDGDRILYRGLIKELTKRNVGVVDEALKVNEKKNLTVCFHFPENVGNSAQNLYLSFSMNADAVQTKNNPNRVFD